MNDFCLFRAFYRCHFLQFPHMRCHILGQGFGNKVYISELFTVVGYFYMAGYKNRRGISCAKCTIRRKKGWWILKCFSKGTSDRNWLLKGRVMSLLLALVRPCFRKNAIVTCKSVTLCSLYNFLLKNVIILVLKKFEKSSFLKKYYFWPTFHIFNTREKIQKFLKRIAFTYKYT